MNDRFCSLDLLEDIGKGFEPFWDNLVALWAFSGKKLNNQKYSIFVLYFWCVEFFTGKCSESHRVVPEGLETFPGVF